MASERIMRAYRDEQGKIYYSYPNLNGYPRSRLNNREKGSVIDKQNNICPYCEKPLIFGVITYGPILSLKTMKTTYGNFISYVADIEFHHRISVKDIQKCENLYMNKSIDTIDNFLAVHRKCHKNIHAT